RRLRTGNDRRRGDLATEETTRVFYWPALSVALDQFGNLPDRDDYFRVDGYYLKSRQPDRIPSHDSHARRAAASRNHCNTQDSCGVGERRLTGGGPQLASTRDGRKR